MENVGSKSHFSVYDTVTEKIVQAIHEGAGVYVMPWHGGSPPNSIPVNASTHASYRGVNILALWAEATVKGYPSDNWASYRQWQELGAQVRRGEHGTIVVFFKEIDSADEMEEKEPEQRKRRVIRAYRVFNAAQVDGWDDPPPPVLPAYFGVKDADAFVQATKARIRHGGSMARYILKEDVIEIPEWKQFRSTATSTSSECYYSVLLHELTHWSSAPHRLNRVLGERFGDEAYAMEELIAELGAAFLCAALGIGNEPRRDHAAYVANWLTVLDNDHKAIFTAAAQAQKAVEYLAGIAKAGGWTIGTPSRGDQP